MKLSLDSLRRAARKLRRAYEVNDPGALQRLRVHAPRSPAPLCHADFLHVIAQENGFASWPRLKLAADTIGLDRAAKQQRLKIALAHGQNWVVDQLLSETPDLADGLLGLQIALYDKAAVSRALAADPAKATKPLGPRSPICHLAFSKWCHARPDLHGDMLAIAEMLASAGAYVNDSIPISPNSNHRLSALYGAIGHANNMALGRWLLEHGADPNDGESLYHATELGHRDGVALLLAHGADPKGTNALFRAMDFHDIESARMLIDAGAKVEDFNAEEVGGETPWTYPALFQAARQGSDNAMITLVLDNGANIKTCFKGATPYAAARVYGNAALADALTARGANTDLSDVERHLSTAADGPEVAVNALKDVKLPAPFTDLLREILPLPGRLPHLQRLVALGLDPDRPDKENITPVQIAGWEGLPEIMRYLLSLSPDIHHINGYGGTLISTILHGSENNPNQVGRDYEACLRLALKSGALLSSNEIAFSGREDLAATLADLAETYPEQRA